jgi:hypothetical protein
VIDRHNTLISVSTSKTSSRTFLELARSDIFPTNGLEMIDINAPSTRNMEVNRWVRDVSSPRRFSKM